MSIIMFKLPDGSLTEDPIKAAEKWAGAFNQAHEAMSAVVKAFAAITDEHPDVFGNKKTDVKLTDAMTKATAMLSMRKS